MSNYHSHALREQSVRQSKMERLEAENRQLRSTLEAERKVLTVSAHTTNQLERENEVLDAENEKLRAALQKLYDATLRQNRATLGPAPCVICGHNIGCTLNCPKRDAAAVLTAQERPQGEERR